MPTFSLSLFSFFFLFLKQPEARLEYQLRLLATLKEQPPNVPVASRPQLLQGNSNTYLAKSSQLNPPVIVSRVRFVPFSDHPRTICMRVEVYGCPYTGESPFARVGFTFP